MRKHLSFSGWVRAAAAVAALTAGIVACNRGDEAQAPAAQSQAQSPVQTLNTPESVVGCLRAGDAPDTFVLTSPQATEGTAPVTYQVVATSGVNLTEHVGERVAINGVVREQQTTTSASAPAPATDDKPRGTAGTPTVQTSATLQMRRIEATSISRAAGDCDK